MDGAQVWWVDKANRFIIIGLTVITLWSAAQWISYRSTQLSLTRAINDIALLQEQTSKIIRLQIAVDAQQDVITQRIDVRLDRIEGNTEVIKEVLVAKSKDKGAAANE